MKLHYIGILKNESKPAHELCAEKELSDYSRFTRNSYAEFMTLFSKTFAERTKPGQQISVEEQASTFHTYARKEGIAAVVITDHDYPSRAAHNILTKVAEEFLVKHPRSSWADSTPTLAFPELKEYLTKYQDSKEADSIENINNLLADTKGIMIKTMESMLDRGEKLDELVAKSEGLSSQSKMFYKQAKKQNSCCVVM